MRYVLHSDGMKIRIEGAECKGEAVFESAPPSLFLYSAGL